MIRESGLIVPDVMGHGTLELFDDRTGKRVHRESFENFVSAETKKYMKWLARKTFWTGIAGTRDISGSDAAGSNSFESYGSGIHNTGSYRDPSQPFQMTDGEPMFNQTHCAVWTDTSAEDPVNEINAAGQIIAYSDKQTYSGTDTKRGAVNLLECSSDPTKTRWVFDWPTTAGNGTFQSVGWLGLSEDANRAYQNLSFEESYTAPAFGQPGTPYLGTGYDFPSNKIVNDDPNDRLLSIVYDAGSPFNYRVRPVSYAGVWGASLFSVGNSWAPGGLARDGTNLWIADSNRNGNPCLRRYDLTGTQNASLAQPWVTVLGVSTPAYSISNIAFDGTNIWVVTDSFQKAWKINPSTGAVLQTIDTSTATAYVTRGITVDPGGDIWIQDNGNIISRWSATGSFKGSFTPNNIIVVSPAAVGASWISQTWRNSGGVSALYIGYYDGPQGFFRIGMRSLGARTLLGSAVTKANTQTMKVTYEFDYT